jgi:hypothetical protein
MSEPNNSYVSLRSDSQEFWHTVEPETTPTPNLRSGSQELWHSVEKDTTPKQRSENQEASQTVKTPDIK